MIYLKKTREGIALNRIKGYFNPERLATVNFSCSVSYTEQVAYADGSVKAPYLVVTRRNRTMIITGIPVLEAGYRYQYDIYNDCFRKCIDLDNR